MLYTLCYNKCTPSQVLKRIKVKYYEYRKLIEQLGKTLEK